MDYKYRPGYFKRKLFLSSLLLLCTFSLMAQQLKPEKVEAFYDTTAIPELFSQVPVGFTFIYPNGAKASTGGYLRGRINWKSLKVYSEQGEVHRGRLDFDAEKIWKNNHQIHFKISYANTTLYCDLELPYLQKIRFNLYTDSIKKNVPYYLNVEGVFSSGKIYPLDTERLKFYNSAGEMDRNILKISDKDTVKNVRVSAIFKWDTTMQSEAVIPVKQYVEKVSLPTKEELLEQWKKQKR